MTDSIVIVGAARTPLGAFGGQFRHTTAPELGAAAVVDALTRLPLEHVAELQMGCVLSAGVGQAPARQVVMQAGLPLGCGATTVNRVCGSGLKTVEACIHSLSYQRQSGNPAICVAGGMENMSLAPHLIPNSREGHRLGSIEATDHLFVDGLIDAGEGRSMGEFAEQTAEQYQFSREAQDEFAQRSLKLAQEAIAKNVFAPEIAAVVASGHKDKVLTDEIPSQLKIEKIPNLKPAFKKNGTITAANASSLADGAAAVALAFESVAVAEGYPILARVKAMASHSQEPKRFTTAPVPAIQKLLESQALSVQDIDVWEINEAFAVVPMAAMADLEIDRAKLNIAGGACALGHPLGATGTRILVTLLHAMQRRDATLGLASLCIGGGEAMAVLLERV